MLTSNAHFLNRRSWLYQWRYLRGNTPWETGRTPVEVIDFINTHPPGRALDIGCGTGTHALTLAQHRWEVTGIDFAARAIRKARVRAAKRALPATFILADVTRPGCLDGTYDFVLDIGCLFSLRSDERAAYAGNLSRLLKPDAWYLLFAWLPRFVAGKPRGISPEAVDLLLAGSFSRFRMTIGKERGKASAWYWYRRR
jgi:SAM-dependent methyltransferase